MNQIRSFLKQAMQRGAKTINNEKLEDHNKKYPIEIKCTGEHGRTQKKNP